MDKELQWGLKLANALKRVIWLETELLLEKLSEMDLEANHFGRLESRMRLRRQLSKP